MCDQHQSPSAQPTILPLDEARDKFERNLEALEQLATLQSQNKLVGNDPVFVKSLLDFFANDLNLSRSQWYWVGEIASRYASIEPIYGSFNAILVMFRLAQSHGLKRPRIRLLSSDAEPVYFELWFKPGEKDEKVIEIMRGGYAGHGRRQFAGWIHHDSIVPFRTERLTVGMKNTLQDLALDPQGVAKAMAQRLSACMYCGQRLSDQESKERGYGPVCAGHWGQPWGTASNKPTATPTADDILQSLFAT